jgi:2-polyprenyl-3-methyl-5-hydroxy-6-metoxy-1,4-benzoquinol methylase
VKRERWNEKWRERLDGGNVEPSRSLVNEVEALPPGRALDLACGAGRNAIWLAARGWRVTAVDYSEVALAEARRRASAQGVDVDWILADVTVWEPEPGAYDLVCILYLQVPAQDRVAVLAAATSALAAGGTLLLVGHHRRNLEEGVGGPSSPDVLIEPEDVVASLPGFAIERSEAVLRPVETEEGTRQAIDALVRARRLDA